MIWVYWITGIILGLLWMVPVLHAILNFLYLSDITKPEWLPPDAAPLPSLTIVAPARNEENYLEPALRSLLHLDYPDYKVVAVNDRSQDRTGEIMERLAGEAAGRLRVLHVRDLPPGWLGKTHAMWLGARQEPGEWLLFTDADCIFHPQSLRRALCYAIRKNVDHLVLLPTAVMLTFGERMVMSFLQIIPMFAYRFWKVGDPASRESVGIGAFNLVRRNVYERIGTFEKLRLEIVDDLKLGETIKKSGFRQEVVIGTDMVSLRWGVGAIGLVGNFEKNLFAFLRFRLSWTLLACCGFLFLSLWPFLGLLLAPGWAKAGFVVAMTMCAAAYSITSAYTRVPPWYFMTSPVAAVLCAWAAVRSAFLAIRDGGVTWRGTKYALKQLREKQRTG